MENFNKKIKSMRLINQLTQTATAEMLGVPLRTYEDWETDRRHPSDFVQNSVVQKLLGLAEPDTVRWVKLCYAGEYSDIEFYRMSSEQVNHFHTDNCAYVDCGYDDSTAVKLYELMNEDDYNYSIYANSSITADFTQWYGDSSAKVLVIGLHPGFDE